MLYLEHTGIDNLNINYYRIEVEKPDKFKLINVDFWVVTMETGDCCYTN